MATKKKVAPVTKVASEEKKSEGQTKLALKIDKNYPLVVDDRIDHVIVLGCGGTGSYVIPGIARLLYSMKDSGQHVPTFTLVDADEVETKNLIRQNFSPGDVGRNKAEALATRYAGAFALEIAYQDKFLEKEADIQNLFDSVGGATMIISCVDNIRTRLSIRNAIHSYRDHYKNIYWIDTGNEAEAGQVVLAARIGRWAQYHLKDSPKYPLPDIFDLYPELEERAKESKFASELSCAELAESSPQFGFVNHNAANFALNFAFDVFQGNPIKVHAVEFSIKNKVAHKPLVRSNIEKWKEICRHYEGIDMNLLVG